jgi:hypothetical protein
MRLPSGDRQRATQRQRRGQFNSLLKHAKPSFSPIYSILLILVDFRLDIIGYHAVAFIFYYRLSFAKMNAFCLHLDAARKE